MRRLQLEESNSGALRILCLGAHCDDIEIGCGGTILKLLEERPSSHVHWTIFSSGEPRKQEAADSAARFLETAETSEISFFDFEDGFFPYKGSELKRAFETIKETVDPDLIFTHYRYDAHQDHRKVCELTWNTFRDHFILEYEIPKYDGDLGQPNTYVWLDEEICNMKIELLMKSFPSQSGKHWWKDHSFRSLLQLRAIECRAPGGYAEAFYSRKLVVGKL